MVHNSLTVLGSVAVFAAAFAVLAAVFRAQVRRYNRSVATSLLDDRPGSADPAFLEAMLALPAPDWRVDWNTAPARLGS
jgi:hypothetical protein